MPSFIPTRRGVEIILISEEPSLVALAENNRVTVMKPEAYLRKYYPSLTALYRPYIVIMSIMTVVRHELYDSLTQMWAEREKEELEQAQNSSAVKSVGFKQV